MHVTGKIRGYVHDFSNPKLRESQLDLHTTCFDFYFYFILKGTSLFTRIVKKLSIGGNDLTNINLATISIKLKFINTYKYFQTSLSSLAATIDENEKSKIELLLNQFISQHHYFCFLWKSLSTSQKDEIIDILNSGKVLIPYKKIMSMHNLDKSLERHLFNKGKSYSDLKQEQVSDEDCKKSKYLYSTLKMRNPHNMNDLYNAQDVILLCEIFKNKFQIIHKKFVSILENAILQVL